MLKKLKNPVDISGMIEVVEITPEMARAWLDMNEGNRKLTRSVVAKYADDMQNGRWRITGDAIRFDDKANLLDGQHRLAAAVAANTSFKSLVIYNLDSKLKTIIDAGKKRSHSDVLDMAGYHNTSALAGVVRLMCIEAEKDLRQKSGVSNSVLMEMLERHPQLPLYCLQPGQLPIGISGRHVSLMNYIASCYLPAKTKAHEMIKVLQTGVPSYDGCAMHAFRERMIRIQASQTENLTMEQKWRAIKHAWNLFSARESIRSFRLPTSDVKITNFDPAVFLKRAEPVVKRTIPAKKPTTSRLKKHKTSVSKERKRQTA